LVGGQAASGRSLGDEPEVEHLEVAQTAVDEFARPARGAGGEVARLDEADAQTPGRGIEGRAATDDAAADDEDVELVAGHGRERSGTGFGREGYRSHAPSLAGTLTPRRPSPTPPLVPPHPASLEPVTVTFAGQSPEARGHWARGPVRGCGAEGQSIQPRVRSTAFF